MELQDTRVGERKTGVTERRMFAKCQVCGARLDCPREQDQWFWIKEDEVKHFLDLHRKTHGIDKAVGIEVEFVSVIA